MNWNLVDDAIYIDGLYYCDIPKDEEDWDETNPPIDILEGEDEDGEL